jgi:hypothetical protein
MTRIIIKPTSPIYQTFTDLINNADRVFFGGVPGVGKSLMVQQLTLMAQKAGRTVHLFQYDAIRPAFETPELLKKYPQDEGATHPMVIQACSIWARRNMVLWSQTHATPEHMLVGEVPLIGNRLMEMARSIDDDAEAILADGRTQFVIPVPSVYVRETIEKRREQTIANPSHENEKEDAPPNVLRAMWQELYRIAGILDLRHSDQDSPPYSPEIYSAVYQYLLQHRNHQILNIDELLTPIGSAYDYSEPRPELKATEEEAKQIIEQLERDSGVDRIVEDAELWYDLSTKKN